MDPLQKTAKPDDHSNALKTPGATLKQVKDVVNKGVPPAGCRGHSATPVSTPGQGGKMEEVEADEVVAEEETAEEAVVSEEETTETTDETEVVASLRKPPKKKFLLVKNSILQLKKMLTHFFLATSHFPRSSEKRQN